MQGREFNADAAADTSLVVDCKAGCSLLECQNPDRGSRQNLVASQSWKAAPLSPQLSYRVHSALHFPSLGEERSQPTFHCATMGLCEALWGRIYGVLWGSLRLCGALWGSVGVHGALYGTFHLGTAMGLHRDQAGRLPSHLRTLSCARSCNRRQERQGRGQQEGEQGHCVEFLRAKLKDRTGTKWPGAKEAVTVLQNGMQLSECAELRRGEQSTQCLALQPLQIQSAAASRCPWLTLCPYFLHTKGSEAGEVLASLRKPGEPLMLPRSALVGERGWSQWRPRPVRC